MSKYPSDVLRETNPETYMKLRMLIIKIRADRGTPKDVLMDEILEILLNTPSKEKEVA